MIDANKIKLDIGCGKNKLAGYTGIDIDPNSDADIVASAFALPFKDESIDEIYSAHLVEHFNPNEAQRFFDEIYRVLKRGGTAYLKIDREWSERRLLKKDSTHKHRYAAEEIRQMIKKFSKSKIKSGILFLGIRRHIKNFCLPRKKIFISLEK